MNNRIDKVLTKLSNIADDYVPKDVMADFSSLLSELEDELHRLYETEDKLNKIASIC